MDLYTGEHQQPSPTISPMADSPPAVMVGEVTSNSPTMSRHTSIRSRSSSSSSSAGGSCTSTVEYDQEPWSQFSQRVEKLCGTLWPPPKTIRHVISTCQAAKHLRSIKCLQQFVPVPQIPLLERLHGGGYNRIVGIMLPSSYGGDKLILRVPREKRTRQDREVAVLDYVRSNTPIPVPTVIAKDFSCNNSLEKPYVLQRRVPGCDLGLIWNDINHSQRCDVARDVGKVVNSLLSLESPYHGILEATIDGTANTQFPHIIPFELKGCDGEIIDESESQIYMDYRNTLSFFETQFMRWRAVACDGTILIEVFDAMLEVVREMDASGLFASLNCLCHVDLHPRNIMVETETDVSLKVTAVLDWDEAVFALKQLNCEPPWWLWDDADYHLDENGLSPWPYEMEGANYLPSTPEKQELKHIFEAHAGPEYARLAYDKPSRLIRCLFRLATIGLQGNQEISAGQRVVREWKELRNSL
ncbi:hypothetical protein N7G274_003970 [Stereocaulon virgatum]|uniref:Aminoglycoside phosphotransferase domain-containing protein n=1 Tax=Stereocaulon virgatum TaxID=373712 RepID=A0ABR4AD26_9LECA